MALEAKLVQKLGQSLLMTPQLQQAIKLLQLGRLEYIDAIQQELLENPILEEQKEEESSSDQPNEINEKNPDFTVGDDQSPVDIERYLENFTDYRGTTSPKNHADHDERPPIEATLTKEETLKEHLASQVRMLEIEDEDREIAIHIIGNLDRNGFLCCTYEEIVENTGKTLEDIVRVIDILKELDPAGICARDLRECLLFQLDFQGKKDALEGRIVDLHLDKLEKRKYDQIAKVEKVELEAVYKAIKNILELEPRPGRPFADDETRYIVPDIYVQKINDEYLITLNEDGIPKLRISPYYMDVLKNPEGDATGDRTYLNDRLKAASWLIKSIHQRQHTIYKVTESIVKFQREFFDYGVEKLKPLVLKDVADDIGMHESTVSRVTTNKYAHTPQGVFELKYFFTTAIKTAHGDVSSSSVKERIKQIINEEDPKKPISDQKIVELLTSENVEIARRTVAKYRESLGILSSSKRKKVF